MKPLRKVLGKSFFLLLALMVGNRAAPAARAVFVENGRPVLALTKGKQWRESGGLLECEGRGNYLYAAAVIGRGDFGVRARLRLENLENSAAAFELSGANRFGFSGKDGKMFVEGPLFGPSPRSLARPPIRDGEAFLFEATRKGGVLRFLINGKEVFRAKCGSVPLKMFGFRPWRSKMGIADFSAEGDIRVPNSPLKPPSYSIPTIDLANETHRRVIVDKEPGQYLGHPSTVLLRDNKTIIVVYPKGHGRGAIVMKKSFDGGLTWSERLPVPANWATSKETPTLFRLTDPNGTERIVLFSGLYPIRMALSEDNGKSWTPLRPIGDFGGIVVMSSVVRLKDGTYMALFHDDGRFLRNKGRVSSFKVYKTLSRDGGLTWSEPQVIAEHPIAHICEPGAVRSPDGRQIAVLLRENSRLYNSMVIFSNDEGKSWSAPVELPASLTGDRHVARYAPDGRLVVVFRDTTRVSPTYGDFVAWVGTYDDIVHGREGQYRARLLDNKSRPGDTGYAGLELLPDGTFVATTYCCLEKGKPPLVASVRFKLEEIDARAAGLPR